LNDLKKLFRLPDDIKEVLELDTLKKNYNNEVKLEDRISEGK